MTSQATYKLSIKCANPTSYSLSSVVANARSSTPLDVQAATANLQVEADGGVPLEVVIVVRYVLTEFFSLLHRTGLYNRQKQLWEALSRITDVEVNRQQQGIFQRTALPFLDFQFNDGKGRPLIYCLWVEPEAAHGAAYDDRKQKDFLKAFLQRAEKLRASKGTLAGLLLICPAQFPENILKFVEDMTGATDPIGKFESILPEPLLLSIDLLEIDLDAISSDAVEPASVMRLIHPKLSTKNRPAAEAVRAVQNFAPES